MFSAARLRRALPQCVGIWWQREMRFSGRAKLFPSIMAVVASHREAKHENGFLQVQVNSGSAFKPRKFQLSH